jgi:hypothetical protein
MIDSTKLTQIILTMARHLSNCECELAIRGKIDYVKREGRTERIEVYIVRVYDTLDEPRRLVDESAQGLTPEEALKSLLERLMTTLGHKLERLQQATDVLPEELRPKIKATLVKPTLYCPDCGGRMHEAHICRAVGED